MRSSSTSRGSRLPQVTELRRQVRESGSKYVVVKNTLALIAVKDSPLQQLEKQFSRRDGGGVQQQRSGGPGEGPHEVRQGRPDHRVQRGYAGRPDRAGERRFRPSPTCPTRDELIAKVLYLMQHPIRGLATVLQGTSATSRW